MLERERRGEVAFEHLGTLERVHRASERSLLDDLHDVRALQPTLRPQCQALAQGHNIDAHDHVHDQLHARATTHIPEEESSLAQDVKARLRLLLESLIPGSEDDKLALQRRSLGATHRRLQEAAAFRRDRRGDLLGCRLVNRGHVNEALACRDARKHTFFAKDHCPRRGGIRCTSEDQVARFNESLRGLGHLRAFRLQRCAFVARPVPDGDREAGIHKAPSHG
mmetsp:Transcript_75927/g.169850  ORF Transcript_75927/g.169850 Transcript_75927/m.169850 type:complete len:223 (+) Transcript_75927:374-1042(+)